MNEGLGGPPKPARGPRALPFAISEFGFMGPRRGFQVVANPLEPGRADQLVGHLIRNDSFETTKARRTRRPGREIWCLAK